MSDEFASLIDQLPLQLGTLRVFGDWFGRPWDNVHTAVTGRWTLNSLVLEFDGGEELQVTEPDGLELHLDQDWSPSADRPPRLRISRASRVRWAWYQYGRARTPLNLGVIEHRAVDGRVQVFSSEDRSASRFSPSTDDPAVEFW